MLALKGRFPLCQDPDSGVSVSTVAVLLWEPLGPLWLLFFPPCSTSSRSSDWKLVAPPLTDTHERVAAVCTGAVWERGQAWGIEMSTLVVATPPLWLWFQFLHSSPPC